MAVAPYRPALPKPSDAARSAVLSVSGASRCVALPDVYKRQSQHHWQMDETHTQALRSLLILFRVAHAHGWRILLPVEEIP